MLSPPLLPLLPPPPKNFNRYTVYAILIFVRNCVAGIYGFTDSYASLPPCMVFSDHNFDCCNGLLLFVRREKREDLLHYYFVCNTTTKHCVAIPNPGPRTLPFSAAVAYDPAKSPHYKVVRFIYTNERTYCPVKLDIFSSDTGKWVRRRVMLSTELPPPHADADEHGCISIFHVANSIKPCLIPAQDGGTVGAVDGRVNNEVSDKLQFLFLNRGIHSTGVKRMGGGHAHGHDEPFYLQAKHMYNVVRMKYQRIKLPLAVFTALSIGVIVPVYAVIFQQKRNASG
ncbi:hypothetical protein SADUNF_Sadunf13G0088200 [Salix dunnii]|uniref:F-box protein At3g26010-like beta-propeller domain-containing protein n=1 Tax=Salix dunnii TaxID=1413687 RepID=A0A835MNK0_9ROSI|nr:hypothetical protein SADUNF_Sadunf13G0088200 [Salix dunnii]